jgi:hypothetical protein
MDFDIMLSHHGTLPKTKEHDVTECGEPSFINKCTEREPRERLLIQYSTILYAVEQSLIVQYKLFKRYRQLPMPGSLSLVIISPIGSLHVIPWNAVS